MSYRNRENLLISPSLNRIAGMLMWTFFFSSTQPLISARYATNAALILNSSQRMLSSRPFSYISHHRVTTMHICGSFIYFLFFIYFNCHMPVFSVTMSQSTAWYFSWLLFCCCWTPLWNPIHSCCCLMLFCWMLQVKWWVCLCLCYGWKRVC